MDELIAAGWSRNVAEALAENGHGVSTASSLSAREAFTLYLHWNGIIGYTESIIDALDNCRRDGRA